MPIFELAPSFKGALTAQDFLQSQGTLRFNIDKKNIKYPNFLFRMADENFVFELSFQNQSVVLHRNDTVSVLTLNEFTDEAKLDIYITWNFSKLCIYCLQNDKKKIAEVPTVPCAPPSSLINWARKENLIPTIEYDSEEFFRQKVCSCLQTVQSKIDEISGAMSQFWDYQYKGNTITGRNPKKEIGVQPIIECLLSDQMLMSSIQLVPEYPTGIGNLDFMFIGKIKGNDLSKICAEFKNAHSDDLKNGLITQLPMYMVNKKSTYGFYCILNYSGEWFGKSTTDDEIYSELTKKQLTSGNPIQENIRIIVYNVGKQKTASKK